MNSYQALHAALKRAQKSNLIDADKKYVVHSSMLEFLLHGLKYCFPAEFGKQTRGMPTGYAAPFMLNEIMQGSDLPPVWAHPEGSVKGIALEPLYRSVPEAAMKDEELYKLLALADMLRSGNARERKIAENKFQQILGE